MMLSCVFVCYFLFLFLLMFNYSKNLFFMSENINGLLQCLLQWKDRKREKNHFGTFDFKYGFNTMN